MFALGTKQELVERVNLENKILDFLSNFSRGSRVISDGSGHQGTEGVSRSLPCLTLRDF